VRVIPEADPYFRIEQELVREGVGLYDRISPRGGHRADRREPQPRRHRRDPGGRASGSRCCGCTASASAISSGIRASGTSSSRGVTGTHGSRITHPYSRLTRSRSSSTRSAASCARVSRALRVQAPLRCTATCSARRSRGGDRVVRLTDHFLALSPYAARSPFETWILPRQHHCLYESSLSGEVVADLAGILGGLFRTLAAKMGDPAFEMTLYTAPNLTRQDPAGEWATHRRRLPLAHRGLHHPRTDPTGSGESTSTTPRLRRPPSSSGTPGSELAPVVGPP